MSHVNHNKWDRRFMELATHISSWSKDPSTKVGAVIVSPDRSGVVFGYNGFPRGIADTDHRLMDRGLKYPLTIHAEVNALLTAPHSLHGHTLYCTMACCAPCAVQVIQKGITRVVIPAVIATSQWADSQNLAIKLFIERGIEVTH